jgi:hypothetical protein
MEKVLNRMLIRLCTLRLGGENYRPAQLLLEVGCCSQSRLSRLAAPSSQTPQHATWVSGSNDAAGQITNHDAAGSNRCVLTDAHAGTDNHTAAEPDPRADVDRMRQFRPSRPCGRIARMIGGQQLDIRAELRLLADSDLRRVQKYRAEIYKHFRAKRDLRPVITIKRRLDRGIKAGIPEQLAQQPGPTIAVGRITRVVTRKQASRTHPRGDKLRVHCQIHLPAQHLAALGLGGIRSIIHVLKYSDSAGRY